MKLRLWIRAMLGFNQKETNAMFILMPLTLLILFSRPLMLAFTRDEVRNTAQLDSLLSTIQWVQLPDTVLAPFDPNTAPDTILTRMGLSPSLTQRIIHYRKAGGKFMKPHDLLGVYGMDTTWYRKAEPFIHIARSGNIHKSDKHKLLKLDINRADSQALVDLRGIGPTLASRIIKYRNRLGGFVHANQLREIYGIDTIVLKELAPVLFVASDFAPRFVNLNEWPIDSLRYHPYISWKQASSIVRYRVQHGPYKSRNELLSIHGLDSLWLRRLEPYLKF